MNLNDGPPNYDNPDDALVKLLLREKAKLTVHELSMATLLEMMDNIGSARDAQMVKDIAKEQLMLNLSEENINKYIKELKA